MARSLPAEGPRTLWERPLGGGFSAIVADAQRIYTMYRTGDDERVIALEPESGRTVWEYRYRAKPFDGQDASYGYGPNATPLLINGKVVTIGFTGLAHCIDAATGRLLWAHDLVKDFNGTIQYYGYSSSPVAYKNTIIMLVGGKTCGVVALGPKDGRLIWMSRPFEVSYASPILITVDGQDQLVFFSPTNVIGIDPSNGAFCWSHKVINFCRTNCTSAVWGEDNLLWAATKGVGGARGLKLTQRGGKTDVEEVWVNRKAKVYYWNAVRVGNHVYASIGDSSVRLATIDIRTGEIVERQGGFAAANAIVAGNTMILLDHRGKLALAHVTPEHLEIVSTAILEDTQAWSVPTLVENTLYLRDLQKIRALDLAGVSRTESVTNGDETQ